MSLAITPNHLEFPVDAKDPTQYITLTNSSNERWAFKVKTTAPKMYSVKPSIAAIEPGSKLDISIVRLGNKTSSKPDTSSKSSDKFLILYGPVGDLSIDKFDNDAVAFWSHIEHNFASSLQSKKVRVVLDYNSTGTASYSGGATGNDTMDSVADYTALSSPKAAANSSRSNATSTGYDTATSEDSAADLRSRAAASSVNAKEEISSESKKLKESSAKASAKSPAMTSVGSTGAVAKRGSGVPLYWVFLLVLVAFFLGWRFV